VPPVRIVAFVLTLCSLVLAIWPAHRDHNQIPSIAFYDVGLRDVGKVFEQLRETGSDGSYGLFAFFSDYAARPPM